ncbi:MAG: pyruvate kinase [Spirochaetaceae bacterium]|jgi:pyruvate kinase|nr:pyruvate kinase [Spirochaetaceae bacterium]
MELFYIRKTKIVCTMGPACDSDETVAAVINAGMNVARFNFSHGSHEEHKQRMDRVRRISAKLDIPVALMLDTKGPEIRTGLVEDGGSVSFKRGDEVIVSTDGVFTKAPAGKEAGRLSLSWKDAAEKITKGVRILIADGLFELEVLESDGGRLRCRAANDAKIGSRKNVNLIGIHAGLPILAEQDKLDIGFGINEDVDFIAASFLSFPHEVTEIRSFLRKHKSSAKIIAKIENQEGLDNIDEIAALADGIMVARGDLAVQIPDERIPLAQKKIIAVARQHCKPVIIATQMLDSMIVNPRPTRAELTDVANAIFDGTDAVMLSGETAQGAYPAQSAATLAKIACTVEQSGEYRDRVRGDLLLLEGHHNEVKRERASHTTEIAGAISRSAYETALAVNARVILTPTMSGSTARQISRYRPEQPIVAVTPNLRTFRSMLLTWGVVPKLAVHATHSDEMIQNALKICSETGLAGISEKVVLAAGLPLGSTLPLNTIRVLIMGTVLARSTAGGHASKEIFRANGRVVWADSAAQARELIKSDGGDILVCPSLTDDYTPILRIVRGVICEGVCSLSTKVLAIINPNLVWLTGVNNASRKLESGLSVTIDGKALLVYEGTI